MITRHESYPNLAKALEIKSLFFKREDLHPYGSHKGRSIPVMIDEYVKQGIRHFAISSSGNAALAAAFHIQKLNKGGLNTIILEILVGRHISSKKLAKLNQFKNENIMITMHDRPLQTVFNKTQDVNVKALRQSTDDLSLVGYEALAEEISEIPNLKAIFIGSSSGTTAQALAEYFIKNKNDIEVHIIQTSSCHPISDAFVDDETLDEQSVADAIVDHSAIRKGMLVKLVGKTGGSGWIASNDQINSAQEITRKHTGLDISTNSALSVAGLMQAVYTGKSWDGSVACIICGD
jgi:threonine dehydratase